jgi:hypothetical protein
MKPNKVFRRLLLVIGAFAVVAASFFGTLFVMNMLDKEARDSTRIDTVKAVMAALEKYRTAKGAYPILPKLDGLLPELSGALVGGGFIGAVSADPPGAPQSHYISPDGKMYGLFVRLEKTGDCRVEVGVSNTGWWGNLPACPKF